MKITIKRYDFIKEENFVEEIFVNELYDTFSANKIAEDLSHKLYNEYPDSTINIQWKSSYMDETNSINLVAKNQKIDEELLESGKMEWSEYAQKWYGGSFSTDFLKGLIIKKC